MDEITQLKRRVEFLEQYVRDLEKSKYFTLEKQLRLKNGKNLVVGTSDGTKIGTEVTQKIAFWGESPVIQPTVADIPRATFVENAGGRNINEDTTLGGWTVQEVVQALIQVGILDGTVN